MQFCIAVCLLLSPFVLVAAPNNPVVFVGQVPISDAFGRITAPFSNHLASMQSVPRGGGLFIRYTDGTVRNLTKDAGFLGEQDTQNGDFAIAVRDPSVHWSGNKVIFSMVRGAPDSQFEIKTYHWQIYEITGLGQGETPIVTPVPGQSVEYNNVTPFYGPNDDIYFVSDRPRDGSTHLYPLLGENESAPSTTGIWKISSSDSSQSIVTYTTSGAFSPFIDSRGKIVFSKATFLQQDPQADTDTYGAFNYSDESAGALKNNGDKKEIFPEPQDPRQTNPNENGISFFYQLPWEINSDGSEMTSLFGLGRHELLYYFEKTQVNDFNIRDFLIQFTTRNTQNSVIGLIHLKESVSNPGSYYGTNAAAYTYNTHSAGQIVKLTPNTEEGPQGLDLEYITDQETSTTTDSPSPSHTGFYRDPLELENGELLAVHTNNTDSNENLGTREEPNPAFKFRIRTLSGGVAGSFLTGPTGVPANVTYFDPDVEVNFVGNLWELQPVELRSYSKPLSFSGLTLSTPEASLFNKEEVDVSEFTQYLKENNLALVVVRDTTSRDVTDIQQPFNLKVADGEKETIGAAGEVYDISALQVLQAEQIRGYEKPKGITLDEDGNPIVIDLDLTKGRRVLPVPADKVSVPSLDSSVAPGSFAIQSDGSVAALVPADRPLSWQLVDNTGSGVVRERYWFNLKAGEIASCGSCHPAANGNQVGAPEPQNEAIALRTLLRWWKGAPLSVPPSYDMSTSGTKKRKRITQASFKKGKIFTKRLYQIEINPEGGDSNFQDMILRLSINRKSCDVPVASFQTDENGFAFLTDKAPNIPRKRVRLKYELIHDGEVKATSSAKLIRRRFPKSRNKRIKGRRLQRICKKMALEAS